jgi:hypothetical protein
LRYQFAVFSGLNLSETRDISAETGPNAGPQILNWAANGAAAGVGGQFFSNLLQVKLEQKRFCDAPRRLNSRIAPRELALLVECVDERC